MAGYLNKIKIGGAFHNGISYSKGYLNRVLVLDFTNDNGNGPDPESNEAPTIGNIDVYIPSGVKTRITLDYFTSIAAPPYNDKENDLLDAVLLKDLDPYKTNIGYFLINNQPITKDTIITRLQLLDPNFDFSHYGVPGSSEIDVFDFSIRDAVNGQWVN